ncbi:MAG: hypothetical protein GY820_14280 [Gammaproteobacteria bacterium]|nr:hypothetical protein [Gammaproteobacteria bacterium]
MQHQNNQTKQSSYNSETEIAPTVTKPRLSHLLSYIGSSKIEPPIIISSPHQFRGHSVGFSKVLFWFCCSNAVLFIMLIEVAGLLSGAFSNKTQKTVG